MANRLTPTMERHLRELVALGPEAAWGPATSGEWRCAEAMERRGLLHRHVERSAGRAFSITPAGYAAGRALDG